MSATTAALPPAPPAMLNYNGYADVNAAWLTNEMMPVPTKKTKQVIFIMDTTAMMSPFFPVVKSAYLEPLIKSLNESSQNMNIDYGLIFFRDYPPYADYIVHPSDLTGNLTKLFNCMCVAKFSGGGYTHGNAVAEGICAALKISSRKSADEKCFILISNSLPRLSPCKLCSLGDCFKHVDECVQQKIMVSFICPQKNQYIKDIYDRSKFDDIEDSSVGPDTHFVKLRGLPYFSVNPSVLPPPPSLTPQQPFGAPKPPHLNHHILSNGHPSPNVANVHSPSITTPNTPGLSNAVPQVQPQQPPPPPIVHTVPDVQVIDITNSATSIPPPQQYGQAQPQFQNGGKTSPIQPNHATPNNVQNPNVIQSPQLYTSPPPAAAMAKIAMSKPMAPVVGPAKPQAMQQPGQQPSGVSNGTTPYINNNGQQPLNVRPPPVMTRTISSNFNNQASPATPPITSPLATMTSSPPAHMSNSGTFINPQNLQQQQQQQLQQQILKNQQQQMMNNNKPKDSNTLWSGFLAFNEGTGSIPFVHLSASLSKPNSLNFSLAWPDTLVIAGLCQENDTLTNQMKQGVFFTFSPQASVGFSDVEFSKFMKQTLHDEKNIAFVELGGKTLFLTNINESLVGSLLNAEFVLMHKRDGGNSNSAIVSPTNNMGHPAMMASSPIVPGTHPAVTSSQSTPNTPSSPNTPTMMVNSTSPGAIRSNSMGLGQASVPLGQASIPLQNTNNNNMVVPVNNANNIISAYPSAPNIYNTNQMSTPSTPSPTVPSPTNTNNTINVESDDIKRSGKRTSSSSSKSSKKSKK
eukprot:gene15039-17791_t